jgi:hypothetical protein
MQNDSNNGRASNYGNAHAVPDAPAPATDWGIAGAHTAHIGQLDGDNPSRDIG